jgi:hypothetical protein
LNNQQLNHNHTSNMKKLAAILCLSALTTGAFAQGLVTFLNSSTTLSSATVNGVSGATTGSAGSYYYGLLISSSPSGPFTFSGLYATNLAAAGRFNGGVSIQCPGWAAGATMSYEVAVWSASLGQPWQNGWLTGTFATAGNFGLSSVATGVSGGFGAPATPSYNLFGGVTGISSGFNAPAVGGTVVTPEPTSMALAGLGAAALLIFRRRK